eukprot:1195588-Prorocentrum_minimum.AAC.8
MLCHSVCPASESRRLASLPSTVHEFEVSGKAGGRRFNDYEQLWRSRCIRMAFVPHILAATILASTIVCVTISSTTAASTVGPGRDTARVASANLQAAKLRGKRTLGNTFARCYVNIYA